MTKAWLDLVARELAIDPTFDQDPLLETARDVAHKVERKATPLTTFLIGVAVGQQSGAVDVGRLCERVSELARLWSDDADGRTS